MPRPLAHRTGISLAGASPPYSSRWLNRLRGDSRSENYIRHFVASLCDIDAFEAEVLASAAAGGGGVGGPGDVGPGFGLEPEILYDAFGRHKSRRGGPLDSREALRVRDWVGVCWRVLPVLCPCFCLYLGQERPFL